MKECVASMAGPLPKASLHAKRDAGRSLGEYFEGREERVLPRCENSLHRSPNASGNSPRKESRGGEPSIIRASNRTSSTLRVDFPAATGAELQTPRKSDFTEPTVVPCSKYTLTSAGLHPSRHGGRPPELYSYSAVKFTEVEPCSKQNSNSSLSMS